MYNPYLYNINQPYVPQPIYMNNANGSSVQQVIRVHGEEGAKAYGLAPNSSILLLDETQPVVWLKMTDGAGYPTITPYDIKPHEISSDGQQTIPTTSVTLLEERIKRIEDDIYGDDKSNIGTINNKHEPRDKQSK